MKNLKNHGITLIALVITIIVLLILAGVSLSLIAGDNGILKRATDSKVVHETAQMQEEVDLALADLQAEYYETSASGTFADYVKAKLESDEGIKTSRGTLKFKENDVIYTDGNGNEIAKGTFDENTGKITITSVNGQTSNSGNEEKKNFIITYDANGGTGVPDTQEANIGDTVNINFTTIPTRTNFKFLGWATTNDATTAVYTEGGTENFTMPASNVTLYAVWEEIEQITVSNYGEYVDLGTNYVKGNALDISSTETEIAVEDWRIFYKDSTGGVYLILADYLPYSYESTVGSGLKNAGTDYPYNWRSNTSRSDLLTRLQDTTAWNKLLSSNYINKGITVKGAVEMEIYKESWNAKGYTTMYLSKNTNGYYAGTNKTSTSDNYDFSSSAGFSDTLYYSHKESLSNYYGFWLNCYCGAGVSSVMRVRYDGTVYGSSYNNDHYGIRPCVYIPSEVELTKDSDGIWRIEL